MGGASVRPLASRQWQQLHALDGTRPLAGAAAVVAGTVVGWAVQLGEAAGTHAVRYVEWLGGEQIAERIVTRSDGQDLCGTFVL